MSEEDNIMKKEAAKKEYFPPKLICYGSISECTEMPGGSIGTEGASGKPHKKLTGPEGGKGGPPSFPVS